MDRSLLKIVKLMIALHLVVPSYVFAHGEEKPGPHGGYIRMPGGFHTEVVPINETSFKVYLLDISFSSPVTINSSVKASVISGNDNIELRCEDESNFFVCKMPEGQNLSAGELKIQASRENVQGVSMRYVLPFNNENQT